MATFIFKETQRFRQPWIWMLLMSTGLITIYLIFSSNATDPSDIFGKSFSIGILALVFWIFLITKMEVYMDDKELRYRYVPFINRWKKIPFHQIEELELIEYNSFWEFGGWGIRYNLRYWLYNTGGKHGIKVKTSRKNFILGTFKPTEAQRAISQYHEFKNN